MTGSNVIALSATGLEPAYLYLSRHFCETTLLRMLADWFGFSGRRIKKEKENDPYAYGPRFLIKAREIVVEWSSASRYAWPLSSHERLALVDELWKHCRRLPADLGVSEAEVETAIREILDLANQ